VAGIPLTQSQMVTLDKRMQQCMKMPLAEIPLGSREIVALEVYVTNKPREPISV